MFVIQNEEDDFNATTEGIQSCRNFELRNSLLTIKLFML